MADGWGGFAGGLVGGLSAAHQERMQEEALERQREADKYKLVQALQSQKTREQMLEMTGQLRQIQASMAAMQQMKAKREMEEADELRQAATFMDPHRASLQDPETAHETFAKLTQGYKSPYAMQRWAKEFQPTLLAPRPDYAERAARTQAEAFGKGSAALEMGLTLEKVAEWLASQRVPPAAIEKWKTTVMSPEEVATRAGRKSYMERAGGTAGEAGALITQPGQLPSLPGRGPVQQGTVSDVLAIGEGAKAEERAYGGLVGETKHPLGREKMEGQIDLNKANAILARARAHLAGLQAGRVMTDQVFLDAQRTSKMLEDLANIALVSGPMKKGLAKQGVDPAMVDEILKLHTELGVALLRNTSGRMRRPGAGQAPAPGSTFGRDVRIRDASGRTGTLKAGTPLPDGVTVITE